MKTKKKLGVYTPLAKSSPIYDCGYGVGFSEEERVYMQIFSSFSIDKYQRYCTSLIKKGYRYLHTDIIDNFVSNSYLKDDQLVYTYYNLKTEVLRVIEDNVSVPKFSFDYESDEETTSTLYQYGLYYAPAYKEIGKSEDCGMLYILTLSDGKFILIDGGDRIQATDEMIEGLYTFLRERSSADKVEIACWICTHGHSDHLDVFSKLIRVHHQDIILERCMFNFPRYQAFTKSQAESEDLVKERIREYYPSVIYVKPHTGQTFRLANCGIEILYTHEDCVGDLDGVVINQNSYNDASLVFRLNYDHTSFLVLGDAWKHTEKVMTRNYSDKAYKCHIVQVAHHGFNNLPKLYSYIPKGTVLLYPQVKSHVDLFRGDADVYSMLIDTINPSEVYFAGGGTDAIKFVTGVIHHEHYDLVGGEYDGSPI